MKFQKLTPNLVVRDVAASMEFYRSVLGFQPAMHVPDDPPYVFGSVTAGDVETSSTTRRQSRKIIPLSAEGRSVAAPRYLRKWKESRKCWPPSKRAEPGSRCR
jgi:catechol 2,3-dioxygenase-like lactoylglutathione lyase family enzyme